MIHTFGIGPGNSCGLHGWKNNPSEFCTCLLQPEIKTLYFRRHKGRDPWPVISNLRANSFFEILGHVPCSKKGVGCRFADLISQSHGPTFSQFKSSRCAKTATRYVSEDFWLRFLLRWGFFFALRAKHRRFHSFCDISRHLWVKIWDCERRERGWNSDNRSPPALVWIASHRRVAATKKTSTPIAWAHMQEYPNPNTGPRF